MEELFLRITEHAALGIEIVAVAMVVYGAFEAFARTLARVFGGPSSGWRQEVWVDFGMWLLLGLQFALAADIVRSTIAPTWGDIGRLAAIAVIRTFLNYFLEKDVIEVRRLDAEAAEKKRDDVAARHP
ncbi:MAG TPA: DUF1622 domain-containing protein [Alphaproteobacteria bacterium]|jgi:uncharacterized membrane protein